jgi:hypothetical protein
MRVTGGRQVCVLMVEGVRNAGDALMHQGGKSGIDMYGEVMSGVCLPEYK